jgi:outer membrane protein, heavy metal efflux system
MKLIIKNSIGWVIVGGLIVISLIGGCQIYQSKPLDKELIHNRLTAPDWKEISIAATKIQHPILQPVNLDLRDGLSPEEAAVIAVLVNPTLKSLRDERAIAAGQVIEAGLLPNPQLDYSLDFPSGGNTEGTNNAYTLGLNWDLRELITRKTRIKSATANKQSIELDIAWQEWQVAEGARLAVYDILYLESQDSVAKLIEQRLTENLDRIKIAYAKDYVTQPDLTETEMALQNMHTQILEIEQGIKKQRGLLNQALGVPPETEFRLQSVTLDIDSVQIPVAKELIQGLEERRLDLLALKLGYDSQEAVVYQSILEQFPKINLGVNKAKDTGNVKTIGFGFTLDLPFFNHNQGQIAIELATRQKLFDEFIARVFESRAKINEIINEMNAIKEQIQYREQGLQQLQKLIAVYQTALKQENIDIVSYYRVQNDLNDKTLELVKLYQELQDLYIALEIESGQYLPSKNGNGNG